VENLQATGVSYMQQFGGAKANQIAIRVQALRHCLQFVTDLVYGERSNMLASLTNG
jgi:hypothetical protein